MDNLHQISYWMPIIKSFSVNVVIAVAILVVGWSLATLAGKGVRGAARRSPRIDPTIVPMMYSLVVWTIRGFTLIAILARFGVQTASIIAVLGAAGLAIGLALQNTLQNIAAGMMLLALRPIRSGEYISVVGKGDGTVEEVGLFLTRIVQVDGIHISLPNSMVWGNPILNYSRNPTRRLDLQVGVRYGDDLDAAMGALLNLVENHKLVLQDPKPQVMVNEYRDSTVMINIRVWAESSNYWQLNFDLHHAARKVLERTGMCLPIPVREVKSTAPDAQAA